MQNSDRVRDTVSTLDEAVLKMDGLGSVGTDVAPGSRPIAEVSPASASAAAGVGIV